MKKTLITTILIILILLSACKSSQEELAHDESSVALTSAQESSNAETSSNGSLIDANVANNDTALSSALSLLASSTTRTSSSIASAPSSSRQQSSAASSKAQTSQPTETQVESFFYVGKHDLTALENWVIEQWNKTAGINQAVYTKTCEWGPLDMNHASWAGSSTTAKTFQGDRFQKWLLDSIKDVKNNAFWQDAKYIRFYMEPFKDGAITFVWVYYN